ncbi:hypothetical protein Q8A67_012454 [Cirrhinus molitorella]|uniref:Uncharacterized protein n=1 Tax=Cirrhinus molitorella TaxID=172907 RepID=A0AA88PTA2_9TELE|nr:hypothetical protein Q8A67_012454 [Cirrhinus molitorella]
MEGKTSMKRPREKCGHCDQILSASQFYHHKRLYFKDGTWARGPDDHSAGTPIDDYQEIFPPFHSDHETDNDSQTEGWLEDEDRHLILETTESENSSDDANEDAEAHLINEHENERDAGENGPTVNDGEALENRCHTSSNSAMLLRLKCFTNLS